MSVKYLKKKVLKTNQIGWLERENQCNYMTWAYGYPNMSEVPEVLHTLNLGYDRTLLDAYDKSRCS
ncbi:MAG: hypothetical protein ACO2ZZ_03030 [Cyclobacteriaceae bacterium]